MKIVTNQSITQIEELSKKETIQKHQNIIDKFNGHGCKLNIEFCKQECDCSNIRLYNVKTFILPSNMSKSEAFKNRNIKCFSGRLIKIKKKDKKFYFRKYNDMFLSLYLSMMFFRLSLIGKDKFFNEGFLDLFIKVFFHNRVDKNSDSFREHDISFIPIILIVVLMIIAALISAYFDILISKNLGWW